MAEITLDIDVNSAIKELEGDVSTLLKKADRKFKVAGARMEAYAKAAAPVDTGFHRRNIRHNPSAPFLSAELTAAAKYASVLELGFSGPVNVSAHTRRTPDGTTNVSAHTRQMNRSARPHIVPAAERALRQLIGDLEGLKA